MPFGGLYCSTALRAPRGVWPWLCFMDAWARLHAGQKDKALEIVRRVFTADMLTPRDYLPHEFLHGDTAANLGHAIQGWNADLFGVIYFGILRSGMIP